MGEGYQLLHIESEQPAISPSNNKRYYVAGGGAFLALVILVATFAVTVPSHSSAGSHNLEVRPDNTPASKRGAGLLLTYVLPILS